jgi:hypothetical protein
MLRAIKQNTLNCAMLYNMHFTSNVMSVVTANNTVKMENLTNSNSDIILNLLLLKFIYFTSNYCIRFGEKKRIFVDRPGESS